MEQLASGRPMDYQRTVELIQQYVLTTTQFLNRFAALADGKLGDAARTLQRVETQVTLLEHKLDSIDGRATVGGSPAAAQLASTPAAPDGAPVGAASPATRREIPALPPGVTAQGAVPPLLSQGPTRQMPPPPPGVSHPPLPPGVTVAPAAKMPPPPPPGAPPEGFIPAPPPPPSSLGMLTKNHPKLVGYFKMLEAGVPVVAIKQKMQIDGYDPQWIDTPDATAPTGLAAPPPAKTSSAMYDSD